MKVMDKLKEVNRLTFDNEKIIVAPDSQWTFTSFPLEGRDTISITEDEYLGLMLRQYQFTKDLTSVEDLNKEEMMANMKGINRQKQQEGSEEDLLIVRISQAEAGLNKMKERLAELKTEQ